MYKVIYKLGGKVGYISNEKAELVHYLKVTGSLNVRQEQWLATVREIVPIRKVDPHFLHRTKEIYDSSCPQCQQASLALELKK